jgi:hypothetical protein
MTLPAYFHTPGRLIRLALKDAGRLQTGADPSAEVLSDAMGRLADLINTYQTQGLKLWLNSILEVPLVAGTSTYTIGPAGSVAMTKPLRAPEAWYVRTDGNRRTLNQLALRDYYNLGTNTSTGAINSYLIDKQLTNLVARFWPVPDATTAADGAVELLIQQQAVAPSNLDEAVAFPVEWYLALRWGLADELATGQPALIMDRCERKAQQYRRLLEDWDVEDASMLLQPSIWAGGYRSRFAR